MTSITITINKVDYGTGCVVLAQTIVLKSGDSAHWAKLVGSSFDGSVIKEGVTMIVKGAPFAEVKHKMKTYAKRDHGHLVYYFHANK
tara:strand:+ start:1332 stop:1592 length:261 start_codon:yes stop_codon:yes gene_type:complete